MGGAFFGDNLSFISDTTIVATRTQGVKQSAKFRTNIYIAAPAALICFAIYYFLGNTGAPITQIPAVEFLKIMPYLLVIVAAVIGTRRDSCAAHGQHPFRHCGHDHW